MIASMNDDRMQKLNIKNFILRFSVTEPPPTKTIILKLTDKIREPFQEDNPFVIFDRHDIDVCFAKLFHDRQ